MLGSSPNPANLGQPVTLAATVTSGATGKVTFYDGATVLGTSAISGSSAALTTILLPAGARTLHAHYLGDATYSPSNSNSVAQSIVALPSLAFRPPTTVTLPFSQARIISGDFNGDQKADLVVMSGNGLTSRVYLSGGDGTFQPVNTSLGGSVNPIAAAVGDFNGDGKQDLVMVQGSGSNVYVLLGNGDGTFGAATPYNVTASVTTVAVTDFNGDGLADLVAGTSSGIGVLLGNGNGTFGAATLIPVANSSIVAVADLNHDGKPDVVAGGNAAQTVSILLGNGDGSFQTAVPYSTPVSSFFVLIADFNGDGFPDLAESNGSNVIGVLLGVGDGTFHAAQSYPSNGSSGPSMALGDIDGDGNIDLVALNPFGGSAVNILYGNGDGTFKAPVGVSTGGGLYSTVAGDFDGDGKTDLILTGYFNSSLTVLSGGAIPDLTVTVTRGTGFVQGQIGATYSLTVKNVGQLPTTGAIGVADSLPSGFTATSITGTGWTCVLATLACTRSETLATGASFSNIIITVNIAGGLTGNAVNTATVNGGGDQNSSNNIAIDSTSIRLNASVSLTSSPNPSILGQAVTLTAALPAGSTGKVTFFDGSSFLGIASISNRQAVLVTTQIAPGNRNLVAEYLGDGSYGPSVSPFRAQTVNETPVNGMQPLANFPVASQAQAMAIGDFNGDGKPDVVSGGSDGKISILLANANGFLPYLSVSTNITNPVALVTSDFDGDGKLDLAISNGVAISLLLGNGDGTFQAPTVILQNGSLGGGMVTADFNQDGIPDLLSGTQNGWVTFLGKGDGTFQAPVATTASSSTTILVADFNRDGKPDLFLFNGSATAAVAMGVGDGTFQPPVILNINVSGPMSFTLGDFNGDGKTDIGYTFWVGQGVLLGNGDGTFQTGILTNGGGASVPGYRALSGDFNGDGKTDLVYRGYSSANFVIAFGDGTGKFTSYSTIVTTSYDTVFASADFNGDGKPDFVVATFGTQLDALFGGQFQGLTILLSHNAPFTAGQLGTYLITVSNQTFATLNGNFQITDLLPSGLTAYLSIGSGWICSPDIPPCARSATLATGASFPALQLTVNVSANLSPSTVVNQASVTFNGSAQITTTDPTLIVAPTTTTMIVSPAATAALSDVVTLTATATEGATGKVMFRDGVSPFGITTISGNQATLTTRLLPSGAHSLIATYEGDSSHGTSSSTPQAFRVNAKQTSGIGTLRTFPIPAPTHNAMSIGDFNGDGIADLVTMSATGVSVILGDGSGGFGASTTFPVASAPWSASVGDFNGDGKADLAVACPSTNNISILLGKGDGTFQPAVNYAAGNFPTSIVVADFDKDGIPDLVAGNSNENSLSFFAGRGDGTFRDGRTTSGNASIGSLLLGGDFNGDGVADLVSGYSVILGAGDGTFANQAAGSVAGIPCVADMNEDGKPDVVTLNGSSVLVYLNPGSGAVALYKTYSLSFFAQAIATADVNGDGHLDVVVTGGNMLAVFFGVGDGSLLQPVITTLPNGNTLGIVAGDFNLDGRTDLAIANSSDNTVIVLPGVLTPVLQVSSSHVGHFNFNSTGVYTLAVSNLGPGATSGTVILADTLPPGLAAGSLTGAGWTCTLATVTCTRSDSLAVGAGYPAVTLTVNIGATGSVNSPATNIVNVSGGGSVPASSADGTIVNDGPPSPILIAPANGAMGVNFTPALQWNASIGATSYDVYLGTSNPPGFVTNVATTSYATSILLPNRTYYWQIAARNAGPDPGPSLIFSFTTGTPVCNPATNPTQSFWPAPGGTSTVAVTNGIGCNWTATTTYPWITINAGANGSGNGTVTYSVATNNTGASRVGSITIAGLIFPVNQAAANTSLRFVPVTPCRIADTRNPSGPFGGPSLGANSSHDFAVPASNCGIPPNAAAYSFNMTVVPLGGLGFLQVWPAGQPQPGVSTLNSPDGRIKANAAIVPAGVNGAVTVFASNPTHVIIDINGYFIADPGGTALAFYPLNPCRIADTRSATGTFGGPSLASNISRDFPILASSCGIPVSAKAYALNMTVVPSAGLGFLSTWPAGQSQPGVSTLNDPSGTIVANAAIVPSGVNGAISVYATNATHLIIDVNGYFAPPGGPGALSFYPLNPCRIIDTRNANGTFGGPILAANASRDIPIASSGCSVPASAQAYSMNATVVPPAGLGFLQLWNTGGAQPGVSTLNASDGFITSNAAIVPAGTAGSVTTFASNSTHLILDINGYFAP